VGDEKKVKAKAERVAISVKAEVGAQIAAIQARVEKTAGFAPSAGAVVAKAVAMLAAAK
jgi:hypothetical protein